MCDVKILDCTLRDGGYVVDTKFGTRRIHGMIEKLEHAHTDIIECGFLRSFAHKDGESAFHLPAEAEPFLPAERTSCTTYALMYDCGKYDVSELPAVQGDDTVWGIRDCFHKEFLELAMADAAILIGKGYRTFIQPTGIIGYTREELLSLIDRVNDLHPYAFSLVDTFGSMYKDDLQRLLDVVLERLSSDIYVGFHSHNNLQLSFALAQEFIDTCVSRERKCIVDATLYGMGRGAGNTNTELVMDYLNRKYGKNYDIDEVLDLMDMYMKAYVSKHQWGYTLPYFIAGKYSSHVDNINYFLGKGNVQTKDIRRSISLMGENDRKHYHPEQLREIYSNQVLKEEKFVLEGTESSLREYFCGATVLVVAPGKTARTQRDRILSFIEANPGARSVTLNFLDEAFSKVAFFGNQKRLDVWQHLESETFASMVKIVTSDLKIDQHENVYKVSRKALIQTGWKNFDISSMMALRLLGKLGAKRIVLAGMDGFSDGQEDDHFTEIMNTYLPHSDRELVDRETIEMLRSFCEANKDDLTVEFLTHSIYERALKKDAGIKVAVGCDKNAVALKNLILAHLREQGCAVEDFGVMDEMDETIYPDVAVNVAEAIRMGQCDRGILMCGTGIGMAIAANKVPGVYAAVCHDPYSAERARRSNDVQIMTMGALVVGSELAKKIVDIWLTGEFDEKRSGNKLRRISEYEKLYYKSGAAVAPPKNTDGYRAVFFDLDGTLLDTSAGVFKAIDWIAEKYEIHKLSENEKRTFIGPPIQDSLRRHYGLSEERARELGSAWRDVYKDKFLFDATPYEGIFNLLRFCREQGIKTGVATNKRADYTNTLLDRFGFTPLFDCIVGTDMEGNLTKADLIRTCMECTGSIGPERCLMIGDTMEDQMAAEKAGVDFLGVTYGFGFTKGTKVEFPLTDSCEKIKDYIMGRNRIMNMSKTVEKRGGTSVT